MTDNALLKIGLQAHRAFCQCSIDIFCTCLCLEYDSLLVMASLEQDSVHMYAFCVIFLFVLFMFFLQSLYTSAMLSALILWVIDSNRAVTSIRSCFEKCVCIF